MKTAFIGAGSWGTTMASLVVRKGESEGVLWARRAELAETINLFRENPEYLPGVPLPDELRATNDLQDALQGAEVVVMAVPSHGFRKVLIDVAEIAGPAPVYVSLTKGIEVDNRKRMSEVIAEVVEGISPSGIAVLTGPNLAKEMIRGDPAASTIACPDESTAKKLQAVFNTETFLCYTHTDVVGCELGGAFKNVIAIAAGAAEGLGFGDNTKATVITRGLAEMAANSAADPDAFRSVAALIPLPFLQACGRRWARPLTPSWLNGYCPLCGAWPALAEVRGIERARYLRCGRCGRDWRIHLLRCPFCDNDNHDQLESLVPQNGDAARVIEACNRCGGYLKSFTSLQGADSLDIVELVMAFEEAFDIDIPDEDAEKIQSVRDAYNYIDQHKK